MLSCVFSAVPFFVFFVVIAFSTSESAYPQNSKNTEKEFLVDGVCKMCKARIENAAYIKGVKYCEWNKETQTIKVVFNGEKTNLELSAIWHMESIWNPRQSGKCASAFFILEMEPIWLDE